VVPDTVLDSKEYHRTRPAATDGCTLGNADGCAVGVEGIAEGWAVGADGCDVGTADGPDGEADGRTDGPDGVLEGVVVGTP